MCAHRSQSVGAAEGALGDRGGSDMEEAARERAPPRPAAEETQAALSVSVQEPCMLRAISTPCIPAPPLPPIQWKIILVSFNKNTVLLYQQPKSAEQRDKVRKASTEGIAIQGQQGSRLVPEQLLTEALIVSDMFDMGELAALELLLAGNVCIFK